MRVRFKLVLGASARSMVTRLVQDPVLVSRTRDHALANVFAMVIVWQISTIIREGRRYCSGDGGEKVL